MRIISIWLFIFLTGVVGVLSSFSSPIFTYAADDNSEKTDDKDSSEKKKEKSTPADEKEGIYKLHAEERKRCDESMEPMYVTIRKNLIARGESCFRHASVHLGLIKDSVDQCNAATEKYNAASRAFGGETRLSQSVKCMDCKKGKHDPEPLPPYCAEEDEGPAPSPFAVATRGNAPDVTHAIILAKSCPTVAADLAKDLKSEIKEHEKELNDLKKDLEEENEKLQEAERKIRNAAIEHKERTAELISIRKKQEDKFNDGFSESTNKARKAYDEIDQQVMQLLAKKRELDNQKIQLLNAAERECHTRAMDFLNAEIKKRNAELEASIRSTRSFASVVSQSTEPRRKANSVLASNHYNACINGRLHSDKVKDISTMHAEGVRQINDSIALARKNQRSIMTSMGGEAMQASYKKGLASIYEEHEKEMNKADATYNDVLTTETQVKENKIRVIGDLQTKFRTLQSSLAGEVAIYGAADEARNGKTGGDANAKFEQHFGEFLTAADSVWIECKCEPQDQYKRSGLCKKAAKVKCAVDSEDCPVGEKPLRERMREKSENSEV